MWDLERVHKMAPSAEHRAALQVGQGDWSTSRCVLSRQVMSRHFSRYIPSRHFSRYILSRHFSRYILSRHFSRHILSRHFSRYTEASKKVPIYHPYNGTGNTVPFPFRSLLITVRLPFSSVFNPFPFCPTGSPSVQVHGLDGVIECVQSLIV